MGVDHYNPGMVTYIFDYCDKSDKSFVGKNIKNFKF